MGLFGKITGHSRKNTVQRGRGAEKLVADHLVSQGWEIHEMNFTIRGGEIDIVARKEDVLAFVEVRSWDTQYWPGGTPLETITPDKQRHIIKTAKFYIRKHRIPLAQTFIRFDVAAVTGTGRKAKLDYIENAFDAGGY